MNHSMEHGSDDLDVVASQAETEVVKDTPEVAASAASPFGSAAEVVEEEVARELPPILDLPESETPSVKAAEEVARELSPILDLPESETSSGKTAPELEVPTFESAPAPAEEPELSRMSEPVAEAPAPVETAPAMSAEKSIYDDPMFGPIKRLLVEFVGED